MPRKKVQDAEVIKDLHFPKAGIDVSMPFSRQPNRPVANGEYARTTPLAINVRGFEPGTNRSRGGQRPGLSRYIASPVVQDWLIQELALLVRMGGSPVQTSQSGRVVTVVAVNQGNVYYANAGATAWTLATNNTGLTPPLNFTGIMQSAPLNQQLYFADGINWAYFKPSTGTVEKWIASAGALPIDGATNAPRLACTWRGRMVLSGLLLDPQDIFMSAVGDATNFDYSPLSTTPTQAVAFISSALGIVGDVVTSLCPYTDDILVIFGDHTIWMLRGDPMAGGQLNLISDSIGGAWGIPWCKDPYGNIYFVSNRTGIFTLIPGQQPQRISQAIEQLLQTIDTGKSTIRLIWDDRFQGLHVFVSTTAAPPTLTPDTHYFFDQRSGAWFQDQFAQKNHNPLCCCVFDGNTPGDRVPLIGSWDGYVRFIDPVATKDDGTAISSSIIIGPILTPDSMEIILKDVQAVLSTGSGSVTFGICKGRSAEAALASTAVQTGTFTADRNFTVPTRWAGHALYVKLTASNPWAMELIRCRIEGLGRVRARGR